MKTKMNWNDKNSVKHEAKILYASGWNASDIAEMQQEYKLTDTQAEALHEMLLEIEYNNTIRIIKFDADEIEMTENNSRWIELLAEKLFWQDCYIFGDEFSLGNFAMGISVYDTNRHVWYIFNFDDLEKLKQGEAITLYAREIDDDIIAELQEAGLV